MEFYRKGREGIKQDLLNFIEDFHSNGILPKAVFTYFITLIPKVDNPQDYGEYRPIFLVSSLYKLFLKYMPLD